MNLFVEIAQQEHPSQWRRKRSDQQAVIAAGHRAGYRSRGITAKPIAYYPFRMMRQLRWIKFYLRNIGQRAHKKRIHSGSSARTTALLPIINQPLSFSTATAPLPP